MYKHTIHALATRVKERLNHDLEANASGIIIDTYDWFDSDSQNGINVMKFIINMFEIDVVLVMGADKLQSALKDSINTSIMTDTSVDSDGKLLQNQILDNEVIPMATKDVTIVKIPKSGGTISRNADNRREFRRVLVNEYFYGKALCTSTNSSSSSNTTNGSASNPANSYILSPARLELKLSSLKLLRVGGATIHIHEGMRAVGDTTCNNMNPLEVLPVKISAHELKYSMLSLVHINDGSNTSTSTSSHATLTEKELQALVYNNSAGFLYVIDVYPESDLIIVMSPCPGGELPSKHAFVGSIKHMEQ